MKNFDIENNKISFNDKNYVKEYVKERKNKLKEELILLEDKPSLCISEYSPTYTKCETFCVGGCFFVFRTKTS